MDLNAHEKRLSASTKACIDEEKHAEEEDKDITTRRMLLSRQEEQFSKYNIII